MAEYPNGWTPKELAATIAFSVAALEGRRQGLGYEHVRRDALWKHRIDRMIELNVNPIPALNYCERYAEEQGYSYDV